MEAPTLYDASSVKQIGVVGTGVIGSGWAAFFVARSIRVVAFCRSEASSQRFKANFSLAFDNLRARGLTATANVTADEAWAQNVTVVSTLLECVSDVQYVQESVVEDVNTKQKVLYDIDSLTPPGILIGSSTSYLPRTVCALRAKKAPGRIATVHPSLPAWDNFVEVLGSTPEDTDWLVSLFEGRLKMDTVRLNKTHYGHCLNAMLLGFNQSASALRQSGVASDPDIDKAAVHLARLVIASGGISSAMVGLVGGGSAQATEDLCTDIVSGFPLASTASFMGKFSIGKFGPVLFVLQTFCWMFTTAYVKSGIRALVRRFFVAPLAVAFDGTVNKAGSLGDFRKETLGRVCELEKIK